MPLRMIDACLNRAREALRVLEDIARFERNNPELAYRFKTLRHSLNDAYLPIAPQLLAARDVKGDGSKSDHRPRPSRTLEGLAAANFKRAQEALRSLEEATTLVRPSLSSLAMRLRFEVYDLERDSQVHAPLEDARLYVILDPELCREEPLTVCRKLLRGGADVVQLRAKTWPDRRLYNLALQLRRIISSALFIVNDRPHVAAASRADGVHVGSGDLPIPRAREIVGSSKLVGATTHTLSQAAGAQRLGADYLSYGPVFPSVTKPREPVGFSYLSGIRRLGIPFFPIGGISLDNIGLLASRGVRRAAVCRAVLEARDPERAARTLRRQLFPKRSS